MTLKRRWLIGALAGVVVLGASAYCLGPLWLRTSDDAPPRNFVAVSERLASSGQPSAAQLAALRAKGYTLVINLAPPQSYGSLPEEGGLVGREGIAYVNIPVDFERPSAGDFELFRRVVSARAQDKVLVHCQLNYRASSFVFLYRAIYEHVAPLEAAEAMLQIWRPNDAWKEFINGRLREHGIDFSI